MHPLKSSTFLLLCVAALLASVALSPRVAAADPITVTSGSLTINALNTFSTFKLHTSEGTSIQGQWPNASQPASAPGQLNLGAVLMYDQVPFVGGEPFASGQVITGDTTLNAFFGGQLTFLSGPIPLPHFDTTSDVQLFSAAAPFTFTGNLSVYDRLETGPFDVLPLFTTNLVGNGTATMELLGSSHDGRSSFTPYRTTYEFSSATTPEPATLLLLGAGLAAAWRARRRRQEVA